MLACNIIYHDTNVTIRFLCLLLLKESQYLFRIYIPTFVFHPLLFTKTPTFPGHASVTNNDVLRILLHVLLRTSA